MIKRVPRLLRGLLQGERRFFDYTRHLPQIVHYFFADRCTIYQGLEIGEKRALCLVLGDQIVNTHAHASHDSIR